MMKGDFAPDEGAAEPVSPFFSVCIPAYNCAQYLEGALLSVASQTFDSWEIVVVDDGSTDGTFDLLRDQDAIPASRLCLVCQRNSGQYVARCRAAREARGEAVVFLDADDLLADPHALEKIHEVFCSTGCDCVLYNALERSGEGDAAEESLFVDYASLFSIEKAAENAFVEVSPAEAVRVLCTSDRFNSMSLKSLRKRLCVDAYRTSHPYLNMAEDRLQVIEVISQCKSLVLLDEPLYCYRQTEGSVSRRAFSLQSFYDQIYVESQLDLSAAEYGVDVESRRAAQLDFIVFSDLYWIYRTIGEKAERLSLYARIRETPFVASLLDGGVPQAMRMNRRHVLCQFRAGRLEDMDRLLTLQTFLKRAARRGKA